jgi:hypothetical protein
VKERTRYRLLEPDDDGKRQRVKVVMRHGFAGFVVRFTASCSGCHETVDGQSVGGYEYDAKAGCERGAGCSECGYRGKVRHEEWIPFDMDAFDEWFDKRWDRRERLLVFWGRNRAA